MKTSKSGSWMEYWGSIAPQGLLIITRDGEVRKSLDYVKVWSEEATRTRQYSLEKPEAPQGSPPNPSSCWGSSLG